MGHLRAATPRRTAVRWRRARPDPTWSRSGKGAAASCGRSFARHFTRRRDGKPCWLPCVLRRRATGIESRALPARAQSAAARPRRRPQSTVGTRLHLARSTNGSGWRPVPRLSDANRKSDAFPVSSSAARTTFQLIVDNCRACPRGRGSTRTMPFRNQSRTGVLPGEDGAGSGSRPGRCQSSPAAQQRLEKVVVGVYERLVDLGIHRLAADAMQEKKVAIFPGSGAVLRRGK